jgi:hypothetical protein
MGAILKKVCHWPRPHFQKMSLYGAKCVFLIYYQVWSNKNLENRFKWLVISNILCENGGHFEKGVPLATPTFSENVTVWCQMCFLNLLPSLKQQKLVNHFKWLAISNILCDNGGHFEKGVPLATPTFSENVSVWCQMCFLNLLQNLKQQKLVNHFKWLVISNILCENGGHFEKGVLLATPTFSKRHCMVPNVFS